MDETVPVPDNFNPDLHPEAYEYFPFDIDPVVTWAIDHDTAQNVDAITSNIARWQAAREKAAENPLSVNLDMVEREFDVDLYKIGLKRLVREKQGPER